MRHDSALGLTTFAGDLLKAWDVDIGMFLALSNEMAIRVDSFGQLLPARAIGLARYGPG
jgi:hypothetical protein